MLVEARGLFCSGAALRAIASASGPRSSDSKAISRLACNSGSRRVTLSLGRVEFAKSGDGDSEIGLADFVLLELIDWPCSDGEGAELSPPPVKIS